MCHSIDSTTLYYLFSTIDQTLGGTIALLAAFVLFRLQTLNTEIENSVSEILMILKDPYVHNSRVGSSPLKHSEIIDFLTFNKYENAFKVLNENGIQSQLLGDNQVNFNKFKTNFCDKYLIKRISGRKPDLILLKKINSKE